MWGTHFSRRARYGSGKFSHRQGMDLSTRILWSSPYQLLSLMLVQPLPGQIITVGDDGDFIMDAFFFVSRLPPDLSPLLFFCSLRFCFEGLID